jgi:hypothetical protein
VAKVEQQGKDNFIVSIKKGTSVASPALQKALGARYKISSSALTATGIVAVEKDALVFSIPDTKLSYKVVPSASRDKKQAEASKKAVEELLKEVKGGAKDFTITGEASDKGLALASYKAAAK